MTNDIQWEIKLGQNNDNLTKQIKYFQSCSMHNQYLVLNSIIESNPFQII